MIKMARPTSLNCVQFKDISTSTIMDNFIYTNTLTTNNPFINITSHPMISTPFPTMSYTTTYPMISTPSISTTFPTMTYPMISTTMSYPMISTPSISTTFPTMSYPTMSYPMGTNRETNIVGKQSEQMDLSQATDSEQSCIVCMSNKRQIVLNPCGHYIMCIGCTDKIMKDTKICPVCQKSIITAIKIFE